jgi:hypothetical protein
VGVGNFVGGAVITVGALDGVGPADSVIAKSTWIQSVMTFLVIMGELSKSMAPPYHH